MSKDTGVQWADSSVNPTMGCDGCELWHKNRRTCYAGVMHGRYGGRPGYAPTFNQVTMFPGRMAEAAKWSDLAGTDRELKPWLNGLPRVIFVSDMSDALSRVVTFDYLKAEIIDVASSAAWGGKKHVWLWLTKRPTRMAEFSRWLQDKHGVAWPDNVVAMTSVTGDVTLERVRYLMEVGGPTTIRGVSFEPLTGPVQFTKQATRMRELLAQRGYADLFRGRPGGIDWAILGGESDQAGKLGRAADLHERHAVDLCEQLVELGLPYFVKQLGTRFVGLRVLGKLAGKPERDWIGSTLEDHHGGEWDEWGAVNPLLKKRAMFPWPKERAPCRTP